MTLDISISMNLLRENQLVKLGYQMKEEEKYTFGTKVLYDKTKGVGNLPYIKNKESFTGVFIEPIFDLLNISMENKKPESILLTQIVDMPIPLYCMKGTKYEETKMLFTHVPKYMSVNTYNRSTKKGRHLLEEKELNLLHSLHPFEISTDIPSLIEIRIKGELNDKPAEYLCYYDVSNHPWFRVKLLMDRKFNVSEYLDKKWYDIKNDYVQKNVSN